MRGNLQAPQSTPGDGSSDNYRIVNGQVHVKTSGKTWSKPLSSYEGVLWREERSGSSRRRHSYISRVIELRHGTTRAFDVNLYTSREVASVRARWEEAARAFNLPALRDLGDGNVLRREVEDIGKSMQELASEGRLDTSFDQGAPEPPGSRFNYDGSVLKIDQRRAFWPSLLRATPFVIFGLLVSYNLPFDTIFGVEGSQRPLYGLIAGFPVVLLGSLWLLIGYQIRVTRSEVTVTGNLGPFPLWRQALAHDEVDEVLVDPGYVVWQSVRVENIEATLRVWPLNKQSAEWLAPFLRSAIAPALSPATTQAASIKKAMRRD